MFRFVLMFFKLMLLTDHLSHTKV